MPNLFNTQVLMHIVERLLGSRDFGILDDRTHSIVVT